MGVAGAPDDARLTMDRTRGPRARSVAAPRAPRVGSCGRPRLAGRGLSFDAKIRWMDTHIGTIEMKGSDGNTYILNIFQTPTRPSSINTFGGNKGPDVPGEKYLLTQDGQPVYQIGQGSYQIDNPTDPLSLPIKLTAGNQNDLLR